MRIHFCSESLSIFVHISIFFHVLIAFSFCLFAVGRPRRARYVGKREFTSFLALDKQLPPKWRTLVNGGARMFFRLLAEAEKAATLIMRRGVVVVVG